MMEAVFALLALGLVGLAMAGSLMGVTVSTQQPPPQQQEEFVPIDQLPPQDQLPAAPLLIAAYSFVVLALFAYVLSVARRLSVVQREIAFKPIPDAAAPDADCGPLPVHPRRLHSRHRGGLDPWVASGRRRLRGAASPQ